MAEAIVKAKFAQLKEDSITYDIWKSVPSIYYSIYMFNVSNAPDVMAKGHKPILQEVGPFVYQKKTYHFVPEKSPGLSLSDEIYHLNIVLVAASTIIHHKYDDDKFLSYAINTACADPIVDCSLFVKHNVSDLLFDGYADPLIFGASMVFPIPFTKFGFFINRNGTVGADGVFNTFTGESDINKLGLLDKWNHSSTLGFYVNQSKCDRFDYSSAGDFRPPYLMKKSSHPIYMFIGDVARSFRMDYSQDVSVNNIDCKRYSADQHLFNYEIEENKCFCLTKNKKLNCPADGVANVSASSYGAPVFVSLPHFLYADQSYFENLEGLHPNQSKHSFTMDFEPTLGIPMSASARLQINVMLERNNLIDKMNSTYVPFEKLLIPTLWWDISIEVDDDMLSKLKTVLQSKWIDSRNTSLSLVCCQISSAECQNLCLKLG